MPSQSLLRWQTERMAALDQIEAAHAAVGGGGSGRRYATQQINQAYAMMVSSQFQGFCRDLHSEAADLVSAQGAVHDPRRVILRVRLTEGRQLDSRNPNPGSIGSDFNRFGIKFWDAVIVRHPRNSILQKRLEALNVWRNAIVHQDFTAPELGGRSTLQILEVRQWRSACGSLASEFDRVMADYLATMFGIQHW